MGCWFVCRVDGSGADARWLELARAQFARHQVGAPILIRTASHAVLASDATHAHGGNIYRASDGFVAVAGTLFYRGRFGQAALRSLFEDFRAPFDLWSEISGHFAAVVGKSGRLHVFGDAFGMFNLFESADGRFVSTSFLTLAQVMERLTLEPQSVYEFAFNTGVLGDASLFKEIRQFGAKRCVTLGVTGGTASSAVLPSREPASLDELLERSSSELVRLAKSVVENFGAKVHCPLSGGYDSRLLLATLRRAGAQPQVYVYGSARSRDVRIAQEIGAGEGFVVEHVDKGAHPDSEPAGFAEHVERDFHLVDGLGVDGSVFDNGGNEAARRRLQADATITSSGGGGEVFRNFFRLSDKPFRLLDLVHAFYRQFDPATATKALDLARYDAAVEGKMASALGGALGRVDRRLIEHLYPSFRCRANFGREISIVGRYGAYFVPFLEPSIARVALDVPLHAKSGGRFEALLIDRLDRRLSRYRTSYGPSPLDLHWRSRLDEAATLLRPVALRPFVYRLKAALQSQRDGHGGTLSPERLGKVIDLHFPVMRAYFRPERFRDDGLMRRVALMEYLVTRLGSKVTIAVD